MTREIPKHVRTFALTRTSSAATTYHFRPQGHSGWALATVNDETLELQIMSDWGNWSYRWPSGGMATGADGRRCTLTEFIADRRQDYCDYLADKLTSREERHQFDSYDSVKAMRRRLIEKRVKQAREVIDYYQDDDPEDREDIGVAEPRRHGPWEHHKVRCRYTHKDEEWFLTKQTTRNLYDELGELEVEENHDRFLEQFFRINGHEIVSDEPWNDDVTVFRPSPHYYQLLFGILPALVRACAKTVLEREAGVPCLAPDTQAAAP